MKRILMICLVMALGLFAVLTVARFKNFTAEAISKAAGIVTADPGTDQTENPARGNSVREMTRETQPDPGARVPAPTWPTDRRLFRSIPQERTAGSEIQSPTVEPRKKPVR